jgi:ion channel-forming bestrophin family protein
VIVPEPRQGWLSLVMSYRGSTLSRIKGRLCAVTTFAIFVELMADAFHLLRSTITLAPFTLIGLALSIFLGFRNNTSYDRFWEGRRLWGALVNVSRSFARQCQLYIGKREAGAEPSVLAVQRELVHRTIAYVHALRMHLRDGIEWDALAAYLPAAEIEQLRKQHNVPYAILSGTSHWLRGAWAGGHIDSYHLPALDQSLNQFLDIQGGCERIKSTPIPHSYTVLMHGIVASYCFLLPFGLVDTLHMWTPLVVLIVSYAFLGLDAVGDEIENPFGADPNDLPLSAISTTIEVNLRQAIGDKDKDVPDLPQPVSGILM